MEKLITTILAVFALLMTIGAPARVFAQEPTNLTIHKVETNAGVADYPNSDGAPLSPEQYREAFGEDASPLPGVTFTYFSVTADQLETMLADPAAYETQEQVRAYLNTTGTTTAPTNEQGEVTIPSLPVGNYWFVENTSGVVASAAAVLFGLSLPIYNLENHTQITDLHVYPKNVIEETPVIDKDVTEVGNKADSANIGDDVFWIITPSIPAGIEDYTRYRVLDTIDTRLDFAGTSAVEVISDIPLVSGADYVLTWDEATRTITVDFTETGREKLQAATTLEIRLATQINDSAVMGLDIPNEARLEYDNGHGLVDEERPDETPVVYTGGRRFVKQDANEGTPLAGAEFVISNSESGSLNSFLQPNGSWGAEETALRLTSDADGLFEIRGLEYGNLGQANNGTASTTYYLKETVEPEGYILPTGLIAFEVNQTSYYADPTAVELVSAEPQVVNNQMNPSIPQTGGMGSLIFVAAGLAIMAVAVIGMKRRQLN